MNFGCVIVNGVSNNVQIMKDFKRYAARLHKNAFRCYNQIKGMRKEISKKAGVKVMEIKSILIKDTTREERKQIVEESFGNISASCDGCMAGLAEMYQEYIDGTKEIRDINMEFNAHYIREDLDEKSKRCCPM